MIIGEFFNYAKERYRIKLKRDAGEPPPWTNDPILQQFRFCHIFREDDRTTIWFRETIREPLKNNPIRVSLATIGFRWFNRIETGERIKDVLLDLGWNGEIIHKRLIGVEPLVTGAYIIHTPYGMNKLNGICAIMDDVMRLDLGQLQCGSLEEAHKVLLPISCFGPFMSYEVITDLRHTCVLENAQDIMTWANPGPGATRGLTWIYERILSKPDMLLAMQELLLMSRQEDLFGHPNWSKEWPPWDMRTVEHTLCEFAKYKQGQNGGRLKRRYRASH